MMKQVQEEENKSKIHTLFLNFT